MVSRKEASWQTLQNLLFLVGIRNYILVSMVLIIMVQAHWHPWLGQLCAFKILFIPNIPLKWVVKLLLDLRPLLNSTIMWRKSSRRRKESHNIICGAVLRALYVKEWKTKVWAEQSTCCIRTLAKSKSPNVCTLNKAVSKWCRGCTSWTRSFKRAKNGKAKAVSLPAHECGRAQPWHC